ncbi:GNAT family N-acetyltransferase [Paenibacillus sp. R14(2021)]|uniref:GNAT family N-acetyltransferase n=1 Tax=Paenibacillus sp. R14(2021) TaxID=2859228 RepID=UPI001C6162FC|nr:GNAT family N-acetyltransferase [Paenibacillus sp. R14(2021)]
MLTNQQLQAIERLQQKCEAQDHVQLKLNWDMLRTREFEQTDFFHYENGELVSFLALYAFGSTVEVCGLTAPSERRKGHFQRLFQQGMEAVRRIGFHKILLNAPAGSASAKAFLKKQGAVYAFSEHQMAWQEGPLEEVADDVAVRPAEPGDFAMRVRLDREGFGVSEADATEMERKHDEKKDPDTAILMVVSNGETVGKVRVNREKGQSWIYGFAVLPEYRGKGIGRNVLRRIIRGEHAAGHSIHLEVETKNDHALGLYESVGFKAVHAQDYYLYDANIEGGV